MVKVSRRMPKVFVFAIAITYLLEQYISTLIGNNIGGALFITLVAVLYWVYSKNAINYKQALYSTALVALLLSLSLLSYFAVTVNEIGCSFVQKGLTSLLLIGAVVFGLLLSPDLLSKSIFSDSSTKFILAGAIFALSLAVSGYSIMASMYSIFRYSDPYIEQSHFALYVCPLIAYRLGVNSRDRIALISMLITSILASSLTLFIWYGFIFLLLAFEKSFRFFVRILLMLMILVLIATFTDISHFTDRIGGIINFQADVAASVTNLSSLVWLNGWSQAYESLIQSSMLGLGFNQMGCGNYSSLGYLSSTLSVGRDTPLNAFDGSFMASKFISEFGFLGIIIVLYITFKSIVQIKYYLYMSPRVFSKDLPSGSNRNINLPLLSAVCGISMLLQLYVRGFGYFVFPFILAFALLNVRDRKLVPIQFESC